MSGKTGHIPTVPDRQNVVKMQFAYSALDRKARSSELFAIMAIKDNAAPPNRITEIREAKGMTIEQLAEKAGMSVSYLWRLAHRTFDVSGLPALLPKVRAACEW